MTIQSTTPRVVSDVERANRARQEAYSILRVLRDDVEEFTAALAMNIDHREESRAALRILLIETLVESHLSSLQSIIDLACA